MPELPDVMLYLAALEPRIAGRRLERIRIASPFLLRSVDPAPSELGGRMIVGLERIGKRIVWTFEDELFAVFHLMIAGRFHWKPTGVRLAGRNVLAAFDLANGSVTLSEAGEKKRASLHLIRGREALGDLDPGGIDPLAVDLRTFGEQLRAGNHTLKRSLTDPRIFSGIGNAYSDEILHAARLSPLQLTSRLDDDEIRALHEATRATLSHWIGRLAAETGGRFPEKVTAFRDGMAVHGRYGQPCPRCGARVQRITYAANECDYCARCQTGGRLLADRALSRLLKEDWPRTLEELESMKRRG